MSPTIQHTLDDVISKEVSNLQRIWKEPTAAQLALAIRTGDVLGRHTASESRDQLPTQEPESEPESAHYRRAAILHLGTIEAQQREISDLRAELKAVKLAGGWDRRQEIQISDLQEENRRLRSELAAATDAWRAYQNMAGRLQQQPVGRLQATAVM